MSNTLARILNILLGLLIGVSVILVVLFYNKNAAIAPDATFAQQIEEFGSLLQYYLYWMYALVVVAAVAALLFPIVGMFTNPKAALKTLGALIFMGAIVGIAYFQSTDTVMNLPGYNGPHNEPVWIKFAGTMLNTVYITAALALLSILYSEVAKVFK